MESSRQHGVPGRHLRILLVDDHADTLELLRRVLRWENHEVIAAHSYAEALRLGMTRAPDVLISDIRLPDGTGWQLLEQLKTAHPQIVGVAASGVGSAQDVARSEQAGYCMHLTKPVDFTTLSDVIERCVKARSNRN